MQIGPVIWEE